MYPLPLGLQASAAFKSFAGPEITAAYTVPNAAVVPSLGRNLSSGANGTVTVPLVPPGTLYDKRQSQLDLRGSRLFRIGATSVTASVDLQNVFNSAAAQVINVTYGPQWQKPTVILGPRFFRLAAQFDF